MRQHTVKMTTYTADIHCFIRREQMWKTLNQDLLLVDVYGKTKKQFSQLHVVLFVIWGWHTNFYCTDMKLLQDAQLKYQDDWFIMKDTFPSYAINVWIHKQILGRRNPCKNCKEKFLYFTSVHNMTKGKSMVLEKISRDPALALFIPIFHGLLNKTENFEYILLKCHRLSFV